MLNVTPKPPGKEKTSGVIKVLGLAEITEVKEVLSKGPKFRLEPGTTAQVLLRINKCTAWKAPSEDQERCLFEGVDALSRSSVKKDRKNRSAINTVVTFFKEKNLRLLQADKEDSWLSHMESTTRKPGTP
ncbi:hypothetical protein HPB52_012757 [Rhipicephalus sanguineus]|uniref:Uncharacterized protein n=1 Tax=Rhipicephalus sanguineus TaxID=34632 RepID=A0A9D4PNU2_RHISA|nr:hypothetical protein HPB52_012757 [Rhipicephalus sanguineus]